MKIFDCICVEKEPDLDLLFTRMKEFSDIPEVIHVICEAAADHKGDPKPEYFLQQRYSERFLPFYGKWNHVQVAPSELPEDADPRTRKNALREYLSHGVTGEPDDIILHGGIDEIPSAQAVRDILEGRAHIPTGMEMRWCCYRPDLVHPRPWRGTVAQRWKYTGSFSGMREQRESLPALVNAGTRLSMMDETCPEDMRHPDGTMLWETTFPA